MFIILTSCSKGSSNINGVQNVAMTGWLPTGDYRSDSPLFPDASLDQKKAVAMQKNKVRK